MIEGGAVGLDLGRAVMVGLRVCWVCGFAGLLGLLWWWFAVDYRWIAVVGLHFAVDFWIFFSFLFFFILRCSKHSKIFFRLFSGMQPNTGKKIIFPEIIYICKHFTVKNNLQQNKRSLNDTYINVTIRLHLLGALEWKKWWKIREGK